MTHNRNELKEKLKTKLKEIFQFEKEDLDFGIYRIMNYKRKEIEEFIEKELIEEIRKQLELVGEEEIKKIKEEFEKVKQKIKENLGESAFENGELKEEFKNTPLGKEYYEKKKQIEEIKISEDLEKEIYNHLINFFSRYYDKGDFISKRRYGKNEKYVVPYNGEEVLLYWANKDQYYIKTTEYFRKYTFKVKGLTVNFRVIEAEEEKGNIKSPEKKFFVLNKKVFDFDEEKRELNIYFEYRGLTEEEEGKYKHGQSASQDKINEEIVKILEEKIPQGSLAILIFEKDPNSKNGKTYIENHLSKYTRRNTTDYFIHKDLKGFLERELDFYIKNEFLNLDDLKVLEESGYFDKLRLYLIGVRAFRNIALKIIEFLAQIENFQKKIWEKKKFVIDTHYVITLDKIKEYAGEDFLENILDEILSNGKQLEEWKKLFGIEVKSKNDLIENNTLNGKEWKKLPIDTKYFDEEFKWKLLVVLSKNNDLDKILDGILIKSENWQALNLLLKKYYEKVKTIYIDPPYNTGSDEFLYKDNYRHSSWLTMIENRLGLAKELMRLDGVIYVSIDDNERYHLEKLMSNIFGENNLIGPIIVQVNKGGRDYLPIAKQQEYVVCCTLNRQTELVREREISEFKYEDLKGKFLPRELRNRNPKFTRENRPNLYYPFFVNPNNKDIYGFCAVSLQKTDYHTIKVLPKNAKGEDSCWRWGKEKVLKYLDPNNPENSEIVARQKKDGGWNIYEKYRGSPEKSRSLWLDSKFRTENGSIQLRNLFGKHIYDFPKPVDLIEELCSYSTTRSEIVIDFFAGSGTTAHAIMKLNKEDGGRRKFIIVEMADYFDTIIIPRIKKVAYSFNWEDGKPQGTDGIGVFFKYHTLEQYEDALENVADTLEKEKPQKTFYELTDYFVKYMLEWETKESKTFLNIDEMKDPFNYKLKIIENYQQKIVNVDLVETFNYLLGLNVGRYEVLQENGRKYVFVFGEKDGKRIAVVWRSIKDIDFEKDKEVIENELKDFELDEVYINGEALVKLDKGKGFRHIEPLFKSLMFEKVK